METWPTRAGKSGCRRGRGRTWCAASRWATSSAGVTPATLAASASGRRPARPPTAGNARQASGIWVPGPPCHSLPPSWPSFSGRSSSQLCAARPVQPAIKPHWFSLKTGCLLTRNGSQQTARQFNSGRYAHVILNSFLQPPHMLKSSYLWYRSPRWEDCCCFGMSWISPSDHFFCIISAGKLR